MGSHVEWRNGGAVEGAVDALLSAVSAESELSRRLRERILAIVAEDNAYKLDHSLQGSPGPTGVRPMAPLARSTLADKRRGPGGPLGTADSRFRKNFRARWDVRAGRWILVAWYEDVPFAGYHLHGATKPGTRWVLPARDVSGLTPRGQEQVRQATAEFLAAVRRSMSFGSRAAGFLRSAFRR